MASFFKNIIRALMLATMVASAPALAQTAYSRSDYNNLMLSELLTNGKNQISAQTVRNLMMQFANSVLFPLSDHSLPSGFTIQGAAKLSTMDPITPNGGVTLSPPALNTSLLTVQQNNIDFVSQYAYGGGYNNTALITNDAYNNHSAPALTVAARTKNNTTGGEPAGLFAFCFNDGATTASSNCHALYGETRRYAGAGQSVAQELNATEFGTSFATDVYSRAYAGGALTAGSYVQSGGNCTGANPCYDPSTGTMTLVSTPASVAYAAGNNGSTFYTGIQFNYNALQGADGMTDGGYGRAILMARGHAIEWGYCDNLTSYPANCGINLRGARLQSTVKTAAQSMDLIFDQTGGLLLKNNNGATVLTVPLNSSTVNGFQINPSVTGSPVIVQAVGADSSIDLQLGAKAFGKVYTLNRFDAPTFSSNNVSGVSCAAGTVSLSTMVVTNGIITHC